MTTAPAKGRPDVRKILVAIDGSELSDAILPLAEALARDHDAELLLLRAMEPAKTADAEVRAHEDADADLAALAGRVRYRGVRGVEWKLWYDPPAIAIVEAALRDRVDLIAMSTHGRGGLGRLLFGSVAETVARTAPVPVLIVRAHLGWTPEAIGTILVPVDGSERSEGVLPAVEALAGPFDLPVHLLHVVEAVPGAVASEAAFAMDRLMESRAGDGETYLAKVALPLEAKGIHVTRALRAGLAAEAILAYLRECGAGLVAMSTHGRTGLGRLGVGSVAERVLRAAPVPTLVSRVPDPQ
jgi:nucleotide-binding universal stress UspA family protein